MSGVLGHLAPVHRCARSLRGIACAVSWATWLLFTVVFSPGAVLRVRCPGPLGSCSPVCLLRVLRCVHRVLGHVAPIHRCACSARCVACAVSWATWLLFTRVLARQVVLRVRCPGPLGSCSPVHTLGVLCCSAVSWATWLLLTGVSARCVVLHVRFPGPLGTCSSVCSLRVLCCVCSSLGHLAPVHRCACSVRCVACVRCPGPLGSCSPVCPLVVLCCVCGVLGHLAPVHRCACSVHCVACAVSWAAWLLFTGVLARCVVLRLQCPGPPGSSSTVRTLGVFCCCAVSRATWFLLTWSARSMCCVACAVPGLLGSCSPVCSLGLLCCVRGVLGLLAPVHWCARSVCCAVCCVCGVLGLLSPVHRGAGWVCCVACGFRCCGERTPPSGWRLYVAGSGWVRCRARARPSRRRLFSR